MHNLAVDILGLCLGTSMPQSEIDQTLAKLIKSTTKNDSEDQLLRDCQILRSVFSYIKRIKRSQEKPFLIKSESTAQKLYLNILALDGTDQFLLLSHIRHQVPLDVLELILKQPTSSLEFRCTHILNWLHEHYASTLIKREELPDFIRALNWRVLIKTDGRTDNQVHTTIKWKKLPAPIRILFEICFIAGILFSLLWIFPKIRNAYERSTQDQINSFLIEKSLVDSPIPPSLNQAPVITQITPDEPEAIDPEPVEVDATRKQPKVRGGETWRFSFAGTGFTDLEAQVQSIIKKNTANEIKSSVVPGGIQLELLLALNEVVPMKQGFEKLAIQLNRKTAQKADAENSNEPNTNVMNLSWYKKRSPSTRKIEANQVLVYVWISTL